MVESWKAEDERRRRRKKERTGLTADQGESAWEVASDHDDDATAVSTRNNSVLFRRNKALPASTPESRRTRLNKGKVQEFLKVWDMVRGSLGFIMKVQI